MPLWPGVGTSHNRLGKAAPLNAAAANEGGSIYVGRPTPDRATAVAPGTMAISSIAVTTATDLLDIVSSLSPITPAAPRQYARREVERVVEMCRRRM